MTSLPEPDLSLTTEAMGDMAQYAVDAEKYPPTQESTWETPPSKDGWTISHNALRGEVELLSKALGKLTEDLQDGKLPEDQAWKIESISSMLKHHIAHVGFHQNAEETIMQPVFAERIKYPDKLSGGHQVLDEFLAKIEKALDTFAKDPTAENLKALYEQAYWPYQVDLREHLHAEETWGIPLQRAYFTEKEYAPTGKKIGKNAGPPGSFVYFMGQDDTTQKYKFQTEFMPNHGMPGFLWPLVFKPSVGAFRNDFLRHADALIETNEPPTKKESTSPCVIL